jgi:hypothetical protein
MYKQALVVLRDDRVHVFSYGRISGLPPTVDECVASFAGIPAPAEVGRAAKAALEREERQIVLEERTAEPVSAATGYTDERVLYQGIGWVGVERFDDAGREAIAVAPSRVEGLNLFSVQENEKVFDAGASEAALGEAILALLRQSSEMNTRAVRRPAARQPSKGKS